MSVSGRFCVYRGMLRIGSQSKEVAVKSFSLADRAEFEKELQIQWYTCQPSDVIWLLTQLSGSQLQHPCLLSLLGFCEKDNLLCLVLPCKAGGDLRCASDITCHSESKSYVSFFSVSFRDFIHDKNRSISLSRIRALVTNITEGLSYLHTNGVIHRDLKPANILLNVTQTQACIADFGSEWIIPENIVLHLLTTLTGTRFQAQEMTCLLCGTVAYMAPEMFSQCQYTPAVDIYSLGVM